MLRLQVTERGVRAAAAPGNANADFEPGPFSIETVSYGVQDIVYQRVFAMIVVKGGVTGRRGGRGERSGHCLA